MSRGNYCLVVLLALAPLGSEAHAFKPATPDSFSVVTEDDRFVFVMLAPAKWIGQDSRRGAELREKYPSSGLYRNDGSRDPLWTVDWYSHCVHPASDGIHLVRVERTPGNYAYDGDHAVAFYASGKLLRAYSEGDLCGIAQRYLQLLD